MKRTYFIYTILSLSLLISSCENFLDINPPSEAVNDDVFSNAQGVEDALNGVYSELNNESLYGKKLIWELPEILSQDLDGPTTSNPLYNNLATYNYNDAESFISDIWRDTYRVIGYTNNIITNLEKADPNAFSLYNLYLGEAYGLRAFLHFEMLRLFAPHIETGAAGDQGIPYVKTYTFDPTPFSTVAQVYDDLVADLKKAQSLLVEDENYVALPRVNDNVAEVRAFLNGREMHFNYYAATATLARVYRMKGDLNDAKTEALKVINSEKFPLVTSDGVLTLVAGTLSPTESIFGLFSNDYLETTRTTLFSTASFLGFNPYQVETGGSPLVQFRDVYSQYLGNNSGSDARLQWFRSPSATGTILACLKLVDVIQVNGGSSASARGLNPGISLIRTPEMYYIAAEADIVSENFEGAAIYINEVLNSRGLTKLEDRDPVLTPDLDLLYNERHKELFCEGQRWFDMKKRNLDIISNTEFSTIPATNAIYVLPIPIEEFEIRGQ